MNKKFQLVMVTVLVIITVSAISWTFTSFSPEVDSCYRDIQLQFGFQVLHILLFLWMLVVILFGFGKYIESKRA